MSTLTDEQRDAIEDAILAMENSGWTRSRDASLSVLRAIIAAHEAAKPGWLPMETAPKDGTNILLLNDKGNMAAGLWLEGVLGKGWFLRGGNEPNYFFNNHRGPTHWMPLPAAPDQPSA